MKSIAFFRSLCGIASLVMMTLSCTANQPKPQSSMTTTSDTKTAMTVSDNAAENNSTSVKLDTITVGAGCFWCVEAVFQRLEGVEKVISGYSGGAKPNPSYKEVCTGTTGHAEVCQITYNPKKVTIPEILEVFWKTHDPTTLNRQGNDAGTQYRSVIFYHNDEQKRLAEEYKKKLEVAKIWDNPIVTEISAAQAFYKAEDYHQNYFNENGYQPYCAVVIRPKVEKFAKIFAAKMKKDAK